MQCSTDSAFQTGPSKFSSPYLPQPTQKDRLPLLLFSTGAGTSRLTYNVLLQWVASMGFNMVSIDHTYDAPIVEDPDGTAIPQANMPIPEDLAPALAVRVADVSSVLDALSNPTMTKKLSIPSLNTNRVGVFVHSLGGATAADAMLVDTRVAGGANMDGSVFGQVLDRTSENSFAIIAARRHDQSTDATWAAFWQELKGMALQLEVIRTTRNSFPDFPILVESVGINASALPSMAGEIGAIDGTRILSILRRYVGGFFQEVLEAKTVLSLQGQNSEFPKVSFKNASSEIKGQ